MDRRYFGNFDHFAIATSIYASLFSKFGTGSAKSICNFCNIRG